ncbi:hypothetical protein ABB37_04342 [Leptomonas pyrrhocoris]|uniref:Uncharacterized protein n=1 Tax=Leptomonas pyrrhocoris TaxID=157538 RepID=A0A0M9G299_LEPPY|nr:hypothetical protein ABB37_04342 [Leptomonas pyrrhocoris]XP_015659389.1 hypothetical protein ABB37_04342 [Leptomonas pyrrhocoris]KPA80949.1 hypothetical protein ABB37_04342 [Leptomonas pyrrhocoris]KPA80950.1 hypothetical protein ABB37_04342 [Leptomonas pyrrhocoris]|eukprot:XP_015659388.1 hypothetical protein ABB37_04342 [Leptomonas pyrrhocoris]
MSNPSVLELSRQLVELDGQAKALRSEVEHLRSTKRSLDVSDATNAKMSEMRESMGSTAPSKSRRSRGSTVRGGPSATSSDLPQGFIDDLAHKCGDVEAAIRKHRELVKEKAMLQEALVKEDAHVEAAEQEFARVSEAADADADGNSRAAAGLRKKNAYGAAQKAAVALYQQRENIRVQLEGQSRELLRLASILQETTDAVSQRTEAMEVLAERKAKLAELRKERNLLTRAVARKDKIADKGHKGLTREDYIRHSNFDRRVALHELSKEDSLTKANDLAIRHRAMQIAKLQTRLELIGGAVAGDDVNENEAERVDVEVLDELTREIEELYESHLVANLHMENIDCEIEKMEWRAGALQHAKDSTQTEMKRVDREHRRYFAELQQTLEKERVANGQTITRLQDDIDAIHRNGARRSQPRGKASKATAVHEE